MSSDASKSATACFALPKRSGRSAKTRPRKRRPAPGSALAPRSSLRIASSTQETRLSRGICPADRAWRRPSSERRMGRCGCSRASFWKYSYPSRSWRAATNCCAAMIAMSGSAFGQAAAWANDTSSRFWASTGDGLGAVEHAALKRKMPRSAADRTVIGRPPAGSCTSTLGCMYNHACGEMRGRNEGFTSAQALIGRGFPRGVACLPFRPESPRSIRPLQFDERVDAVDERPEVLLGQCTPPGGHRGATHAGHDHAIEVLELVIGPYRAQLGAREVGREQLHPVLALRQLGPVHVRAELRVALPRELLRDFIDVPLWSERGVARQALGNPVVHRAPPVGGRCVVLPGVWRRDDWLARFLVLPPRREGLHILDDGEEVLLGDPVPRAHRGPVQAEADDAHQVVVVRQRAAGDGAELEGSESEIARRRPYSRRGGALAVALVAVAGPAVENVGAFALGEHRGGDRFSPQLHRLLESLRSVPLASREDGAGDRTANEEEGLA